LGLPNTIKKIPHTQHITEGCRGNADVLGFPPEEKADGDFQKTLSQKGTKKRAEARKKKMKKCTLTLTCLTKPDSRGAMYSEHLLKNTKEERGSVADLLTRGGRTSQGNR